jgi:hypothetical protein
MVHVGAGFLVVVFAATASAAPPEDPAAWGEHLKGSYAHAKAVEVTTEKAKLRVGLCAKPPAALKVLPGYARVSLDFEDPNLFQDAWIEIARVPPGVDVVALVAKAKSCHSDKRYLAALQAGETLFLYHARCSQMLTPFYYDIADLVAAVEGAGATAARRLIVNPCGTIEHTFTTVAAVKQQAKKPRKLYKHRFPEARAEHKRQTP